MADTNLFYYQPALAKTNPRVLSLQFKITAGTTVSTLPMGWPILNTFTAIASQAVIDDFLGAVSEFNYLAFDATAMGNDAQGIIFNMDGQAQDVIGFEAKCYSGSGFTTLVERGYYSVPTLTNSSLVTEVAVGVYGNIACKIDWGNTPDFDALTDGYIVVDIYWISK